MAVGFAPEHMMFLAASATAISHPTLGSALTYLELQSTEKARTFICSF